MRHKNNERVLFWMREDFMAMKYEVRSPVNALGYGSENKEDEGLPGPDRSAIPGCFPADAVKRFYEEVSG